ncbi:hypothetical protein KEM55_004694 [Ascosphaera atra]|nr:hypothetical protein KEM55_004694 [Ascosphaera atra]
MLLQHGADPNYGNGQAVHSAVANGEPEALRPMLCSGKINAQILSSMFSKVFSSGLSEEAALGLLEVFLQPPRKLEELTGPEFCSEGSLLEPITFTAMKQWPSGTSVIVFILKSGVSPEKTVPYTIDEEEGIEQVSLLLWALLQPEYKVGADTIACLLQNGANPNFQSSKSKQTPLLIAAKERCAQTIAHLVEHGADASVPDSRGYTPLILASKRADRASMQVLLDAGAPTNDGSLHEAARKLDHETAKMLIAKGHDPNFPSLLHYGRSALAELCLYSTPPPSTLSKLYDTINVLVDAGADLKIKIMEKPLILYAMENSTAGVAMTKVLLSSGLWKFINEDCCLYSNDGYVYSPTMYIAKGLRLGDPGESQELLRILKASGCKEVYYREELVGLAEQPEDMVGAPHLVIEENRRVKQRQRRLDEREEEHQITLRHNTDLATQQEDFMGRAHRLRLQHHQDLTREYNSSALETSSVRQRIEQELAEKRRQIAAQKHESLLRQREEADKLRLLGLEKENNVRTEFQKSTVENSKELFKTQLDYQRSSNQLQQNLQRVLQESESRRQMARETCSRTQSKMEKDIIMRREMSLQSHKGSGSMSSTSTVSTSPELPKQRLLCYGDEIGVD